MLPCVDKFTYIFGSYKMLLASFPGFSLFGKKPGYEAEMLLYEHKMCI